MYYDDMKQYAQKLLVFGNCTNHINLNLIKYKSFSEWNVVKYTGISFIPV